MRADINFIHSGIIEQAYYSTRSFIYKRLIFLPLF